MEPYLTLTRNYSNLIPTSLQRQLKVPALYREQDICKEGNGWNGCDHVLFWHVGTLLSYGVPPLSGQKHIIDQYPTSPEHEPLFIMPYKCTP